MGICGAGKYGPRRGEWRSKLDGKFGRDDRRLVNIRPRGSAVGLGLDLIERHAGRKLSQRIPPPPFLSMLNTPRSVITCRRRQRR
jgi:hypothetical protein